MKTATTATMKTFDRNSELAEAAREYIRQHKSEYDHTNYSDLATDAGWSVFRIYPHSNLSRPFADFCLDCARDAVEWPDDSDDWEAE